MSGARKFGLVLFGAILIVVFAGIAIANGGITQPSVPDGDVALVEDVPDGLGDISQEDYDRTFQQTWKRGGLEQAPKPGDAQYQQVKDAALNDLLDQAWLTGEAAEQGVTATDREVDAEFQTIRQDQFSDDAAYEQFLKDSGFTEEEVMQRVRLQVLSRKIEESITTGVTSVPEEEIEQSYEDNKATYLVPESREIRLVVTDNKADADKAAAALEEDSSDENFAKVARQFSTHPSKSDGGETTASEGIFPDPAGSDIMSAEVDVLGGPVKAGDDFYIWKVTEITEEETQPLDEVREQIEQQLLPQLQQEAMSNFVADYTSKWTSRTFCADDYLVARCHNYEPSGRLVQADQSGVVTEVVDAACYAEDAADKVGTGEQPLVCPALVQGRKVPAPGSAMDVSAQPLELQTMPAQRPVPAGDATVDAAAAAAAGAAGAIDPAAAAAQQQAAAAAAAAAAGGQ